VKDALAPLTEKERALAVRLAGEDATLAPVVAGRARTVLVEAAQGPRGARAGVRHAVVGVYDYDGNRGYVAAVDLEQGQAVEVHEVLVRFQLSPEEKAEAEELAGKDRRVRRFLGDRPMRPLTRLYFPPTAAKHKPAHRYAIVFVRPNASERRYAVVDLSAGRVTEVLAADDLAGV